MMGIARFLDRLENLSARLTRHYYRRVLFGRCVGGDRVILGPDVWWNFHLVQPERLCIGEGTVLNGECYINAQGGVSIGRYCHVGKGLTIYSSNHNYRSSVAIPYDDEDVLKPVKIGDCVWIGANVSILPGTTIGDGAIVAMGAVVRGDVGACAIVGGNPAQVIGSRDQAAFERLYSVRAFS
jgi:acetyltransferase-like isoleucine patch superfamily enzyme